MFETFESTPAGVLVFSELLLLSSPERAAVRIPFDPRLTLILGKNDTGKSSILKSLYSTLGAEPVQIHTHWKRAEVFSLLRFTLDGRAMSALKFGGQHALFGPNDDLLISTSSVTNDLGPYLGKLLHFGLKLTSRDGALITPPPAFCFLPFYIDQDIGWQRNWASFARLGQFQNWRRNVAEYHVGLRPNAYYEAHGGLTLARTELEDREADVRVLARVRTQIDDALPPTQFSLSVNDFRAELDALLQESQALAAAQSRHKERLTALVEHLLLTTQKLKFVRAAQAEAAKDYSFAVSLPSHVECPTCGADYENSFLQRLDIAKDENRLTELAIRLETELAALRDDEAKERRQLLQTNLAQERVQGLLQSSRQKVELGTLLRSEGRKLATGAIEGRIGAMRSEINRLREAVATYERQLKAIENPQRRQYILSRYERLLRHNLSALNVRSLPPRSYRQIEAGIAETGSDLPRALLAYYFALLHLTREYSTAVFCPIVIDSPNQQAQDAANLARMLQFIRDTVPQPSQLVLGLEDMHGIGFDGTVVHLTEAHRTLEPRQYRPILDEMAPLIRKASNHLDA